MFISFYKSVEVHTFANAYIFSFENIKDETGKIQNCS